MGVRVRQWKGAWWVFVNHHGRRKVRRVGEGESAKFAAKEVARKLQARLALGESLGDRGQAVCFGDHAAQWLSHIKQTRKHSTYVSYEVLLRRELLPALSGVTLDQITRSRIKALATASLAGGHAPKTVQNLMRTLSSILSHAKAGVMLHVGFASLAALKSERSRSHLF